MSTNMPYSTNPKLPKLRIKAVEMVRAGNSIRQVAKYFGYNPSSISRWNQKVPVGGLHELPTESSAPKHHPWKIDPSIVKRIIEIRRDTGRCAEVIHQMLLNEGIHISISTVKRTLDRQRLTKKKSKWKKYHKYDERPQALNPGDLVQVDTIHLMQSERSRIYIYTLLDVYSRWAHAYATPKMGAGATVKFVRRAQDRSLFPFNCLQTDHGPEFSNYFTKMIDIKHRHSRIRKPNDNGHLERFNRTIQHEFLRKIPTDVKVINRKLPYYLKYYNTERLHLGLNLKTPMDILVECCKASD
jgi:transposase InsO family protein